MRHRQRKRRSQLARVRSKTRYFEIIEVRIPVRFYWTEDGFDGIEIGPFADDTTQYELKLVARILGTMEELMESAPDKRVIVEIPRVFYEAFESDDNKARE